VNFQLSGHLCQHSHVRCPSTRNLAACPILTAASWYCVYLLGGDRSRISGAWWRAGWQLSAGVGR